jgi:hypothetical protein
MTRATSKHFVRVIIIGIVVAVVVGYAGFAFRDIVRGPSIVITKPINGETFATSSVELKGISERAQFISLNGKPILIDENGAFSEIIVLSSGYNVSTIEARDKFGHIATQKLELVRSTPNEFDALQPMASSTVVNDSATTSKATATTSLKNR